MLKAKAVLIVLFSAVIFFCAGCNPCGSGCTSLFNGKDLSGWKRHDGLPGHGVAGKWFVEDGKIVGMQDPPGKGGFLTTFETYKDFELTLDAWVDWPFDSGVFLRVGPDGKSHQLTLDWHSKGDIGDVYCPWTQRGVYESPNGKDVFKKDAWNKLRIVITGEPALIKMWVNGVLVTDFQHTAETTKNIPGEGTIALQVHPGGKGYESSRAMFRNICVRPILSEDLAK
jgi:hypothetical protein